MRSNYRLSEELLTALRDYLSGQKKTHDMVRNLLFSSKVQLRSVLAIDLKSHPRLLFIYNEFLKLREALDQHLIRKESLLQPFLSEQMSDEDPGLLSNAKAVNSFLMVFVAENERITSLVRSIDEAADHYKPDLVSQPTLMEAFEHLKKLSEQIIAMTDKEDQLFMEILRSRKQAMETI